MKPNDVSDASWDPLLAEIYGHSSLRQSAGADGFFESPAESIDVTLANVRPYSGDSARELEQECLITEFTGMDAAERQMAFGLMPETTTNTPALREEIRRISKQASSEVIYGARERYHVAKRELQESPLFHEIVRAADVTSSRLAGFLHAIDTDDDRQAQRMARAILRS